MSFLAGIPWKLVGVLALVLALSVSWFRGNYYKTENEHNAAALGQALDINESNAKAFERYRQQVAEIRAAAEVAVKTKTNIRRKSAERQEVIKNAPPEDDAPLAPVLRDTLDQLPEPEGGYGYTGA